MGSSSSRLGSRPSRPRVNRTASRSILSSFVCGGSSARATQEGNGWRKVDYDCRIRRLRFLMVRRNDYIVFSTAYVLELGINHGADVVMEDHAAVCLVKCAEQCDRDINQVQNSGEGTLLVSSTGSPFTCPVIEIGSSSEHTVEEGLSGVDTSNRGKCLSKSKELIPHQVSADYSHDQSCMDNSTTASTSFRQQQSSETVSLNRSVNVDAVNGIDNPADKNVSQTCPEVMCPSSSSLQGMQNSRSQEVSVESHVADVRGVQSSNADTDSANVSEIPSSFDSLGNDSLREAIPSGLGFLVSNREQGQEDGSVLHVDVMSISSNFLRSSNGDASNREARRNGRRLFWDAFSRRSSRRFIDSPTILFSTDDTEDMGFHDRWLLGLSGDLFDDGIGADSGHRASRIPYSNERRRHSRSEVIV
ncbi:hypothetical protein C1H46_020816 [Malus baccata]|uniref:RING/U-box superfamily protein n=1 Tax=Malus baccata TaxID=106549 RepID=A0A540M486_MALBA|nr:hypothetical protein C1H46_020816 [Malus baccata]